MTTKIKDTEEYKFVMEIMYPLFKRKNPEKEFMYSETARRLKTFRKKHKTSFEDIEQAIMLYLNKTEPKYVRYMHYFIYKDKLTNSLLESYLEKIEEEKETKKVKKHVTNKMQ